MIWLLLLWLADGSAERGLDFLSREVPKWKRENGCYSCHNNGDAARALMRGGRREALADTLVWLGAPEKWDGQQAEAPFRDKGLARIQFSLALAEAVAAGMSGRPALDAAARELAGQQDAGGAWKIEQDAAVGSPATYGTALATWAGLRTLRVADAARYAGAIGRGERWLRGLRAVSTVDNAAKVLALGDEAARAWLREAQNGDGGWGPFRGTPSEAFDTALGVLALGDERGAAWLRKAQKADGSWEATTRPSGADSYAQLISTSGWATLALLAGR